MKIRDPIADYVVSDTDYVVSLIRDMYPTWQPNTNIVCPHHEDTNASLSITPQGKAFCFGCGYRAANIIELFGDMYDMSYLDSRTMIYEDMVKAIPMKKVEAYVRNLHKRKSVLRYLTEERHLSPNVIVAHALGYDTYTDRITIPVFDKFGTCVNIRKYNTCADPKMINTKGHGEFRIYPEEVLLDPKKQNIMLVEGEFDALVGSTMGIDAVTGTGGAGNWDDKFNWMFQNKNVFVLYDNDMVGKQGAKDVCDKLKGIATYVTTLDPPTNTFGKDLSDWWEYGDEVKAQIKHVLKTKAVHKMTCMSCGASVKTVTSLEPYSGMHTMDVCAKCKKVLKQLKWQVVK